MNRSTWWQPWTWCREWPCALRRGHIGRHAFFTGHADPHWFDTEREGSP